jgi:hypothetical protein
MIMLTEIATENRVCDVIVETTLPGNGKTAWNYLTPVEETDSVVSIYKCRVTGHNHTIHLLRSFLLVNLEVTLASNGNN